MCRAEVRGRADRVYCSDACAAKARRARQRAAGKRDALAVREYEPEPVEVPDRDRLVGMIYRAANDDWRAGAWLLAHGFAEGVEAPAVPESEPEVKAPPNPFAEVDELAAKRTRRAA